MACACVSLHIQTFFRMRSTNRSSTLTKLWPVSSQLDWQKGKRICEKQRGWFIVTNSLLSASQDEACEVTDTGDTRVTQGRAPGARCGVALLCHAGFRVTAASVSLPCAQPSVEDAWNCASPLFFWGGGGPLSTRRCCKRRTHLRLQTRRKEWPRVKTKRIRGREWVSLFVSQFPGWRRCTEVVCEVTWSLHWFWKAPPTPPSV